MKQVRVSSRTFRGQGTDEGLPGQGQGTDEGLKHKQWLVSKVSGLGSLLSQNAGPTYNITPYPGLSVRSTLTGSRRFLLRQSIQLRLGGTRIS